MSNILVLRQGSQIIKMKKNRVISELERISELRDKEDEKAYLTGTVTGAKYQLYNCYFHQLCRALSVPAIDDIPF